MLAKLLPDIDQLRKSMNDEKNKMNEEFTTLLNEEKKFFLETKTFHKEVRKNLKSLLIKGALIDMSMVCIENSHNVLQRGKYDRFHFPEQDCSVFGYVVPIEEFDDYNIPVVNKELLDEIYGDYMFDVHPYSNDETGDKIEYEYV